MAGKILIRLHGPFEKLAQKEVELNIDGIFDARGVLQRLVSIYPKLPFQDISNPTMELSTTLVLVKNGRATKLTDVVHDKDVIEIFIPITGG